MTSPARARPSPRPWWSMPSLPLPVAIGVGLVLHAAFLGAAAFTWVTSVRRIEAGCIQTDCQPQYFLGAGMMFWFITLPLAYLLGCVVVAWLLNWSMRNRTGRANVLAGAVFLMVCSVPGLTAMPFS